MGLMMPETLDPIDPRLTNISYSSLLTLHACPRRYQLEKLSQDWDSERENNTTFAFGHLVGEGVQLVFEGKDETEIIWTLYRNWNLDLFDEHAIQKFIGMRSAGFLSDWELVYHNGKPACELGFRISFPDGFKYRGFVDAVIRNRNTGAVGVLEIKTTGLNDIDESVYKNSAQAIGYSIVLDAIFPELSSYEVLYLPYKKKVKEFELRPYTKSYLQRALWIQELLMDIETIKMYDAASIYPMRGESCYNFYRQCRYFGTCTLSTNFLTKPISEKMLDKLNAEEYTVELTLLDLLNSQLDKEVK
jgi:hypothetical protein